MGKIQVQTKGNQEREREKRFSGGLKTPIERSGAD